MFLRKHNPVPSLLLLTCAVLSVIHPSAGAPGPQPTPPGEGLYPRQYNLPIPSGTNYGLVPPGAGTGAAYPPLILLATSTTPSAAPAMPTDIGCMAVENPMYYDPNSLVCSCPGDPTYVTMLTPGPDGGNCDFSTLPPSAMAASELVPGASVAATPSNSVSDVWPTA